MWMSAFSLSPLVGVVDLDNQGNLLEVSFSKADTNNFLCGNFFFGLETFASFFGEILYLKETEMWHFLKHRFSGQLFASLMS